MNHETFTEIYERYATVVKRSVVAQTNDEELAMEICQQTFLAYYRNMDEVDKDFVKAWLLQVAQNLLVDHWRKASTRNEIVHDELSEEYLNQSADIDIDKEATDKIFLSRLLKDLKEENELWYEVVDYICIREMSCDEAAKHLGISPTMLRARLYRARCFLRKKYGKDYFGS